MFNVPLPSLLRLFFFVPPDTCFFFCIYWDIWVLKKSHISSKKQNKTQRARQGHSKHERKIPGSVPQKRRGSLDFGVEYCKNHGYASYLLGFSVDSILGVTLLNIGPTQSVLRIFEQNIVRTCTGAPGSGSFRKKLVMFFLPMLNA